MGIPLQPAHPLREYLKLRRSRAILAGFAAAALLLVAFPAADLAISRLFYDRGFYMANERWALFLHASVSWFVIGTLVAITATYAFNRLTGRRLWGMGGRKAAYLLLVLALGGGFMVNGILKDGFGRARPREITEFGGASRFTPAFVVSSACSRNCSFSSGDSAGAFFGLAFTFVARRRRAATAAAVGYGVLVSAARVVAGAHFLSDTVVSFFVMFIASDALYFRLFLFSPEAARAPPALLPAPADVATGEGKPLMP
jgi:lipid A 4'-phosphatase